MAPEIVKTTRRVADLRAGRNDWFRLDNKAGASTLYIYDEIGFFGVTAKDLVAELKNVTGDLTVHVNSPGGDVFDGIAILNALRDHDGTVTTICDGLAASAASFIMQAGKRRVMAKNSEMMIHEASGLCVGNAKDMVELASTLDRVSDNIASVYADRSGRGDATAWRNLMSAETWFTAEEAVSMGLADEHGDKPDLDDFTKNTWDLSIFAYQSRAEAPTPALPTPPRASTFDVNLFKKGLRHGA
jgi:ATP-dependent Clp endopeptidase proteolytic subunit ClpP